MQNQQHSQQMVKKRNRLTVVCTNCKRRKSKCDRNKPCANCVRLGDKATCFYVTEYRGDTSDESMEIDAKVSKPLPSSYSRKQLNNLSKVVAPIHQYTPEYINLIPNGSFLEVKRSAMTMFSLFTDISVEHRDPYLKCMITFRIIAIEMTIKRLTRTNLNSKLNPSLPRSFKPLSIFDADGDPLSSDSSFKQHQLIHKSLFQKFAMYRKDDSTKFNDDCSFISSNMPPRSLVVDEVFPFFEDHIYSMIPIFDLTMLKHVVNSFYDYWEENSKISTKGFDHVVFAIVLLITKLCQLSLNFSKLPSESPSPIQQLDTSRYIAIVNHYLFEMKSLRKCTLLQLQCLILLRFYHWCGPEDGDGEALQHGQILLGTIISSCKEMGLSWASLLTPDDYFFKLDPHSKPSPSLMGPDDYQKIFKKIWSYVLYWDRKMCLINGQECLIGKSFQYNCVNEYLTWHHKMAALDSVVLDLSDLLNDFPGKVDIKLLHQKLHRTFELFHQLKTEQDGHLDFEYQMMLGLLTLSLLHAQMVHYEYNNNVNKTHESIQALWDQVVHLAHRCYEYFYNEERKLDPFTKFYTNKIVEVIANKICVLLPALVLRINRFSWLEFADRNIMVKFLFGISSMYFNEFGFDYYRCFEKMFTAKITYKILNRPANKDPWQIILQFLLHELDKVNSGKKEDDIDLAKRIPLLVKLQEASKILPSELDRKFVDIWNENIYPAGKGDFKLDLHVEDLQPFLVDRYANCFNIFASFYDHASSQLAENAETVNAKTSDSNELSMLTPGKSVSTPMWGDSSMTSCSNGLDSVISSNNDLELANFEVIQEMFEPLDFISFF